MNKITSDKFLKILLEEGPDSTCIEANITLPLFIDRFTDDCRNGMTGDYLGLGEDIFTKISDLCYLHLQLQKLVRIEERMVQEL